MRLDLHVHSKYSFDSFSEPAKIIKIARRRGLDAISITDHNTMKAYGSIEHLAHEGFTVIPGMEIKTDMGDVIGLFLNEEIKARGFEDVVDRIRGQGGVVILPHPYRRKCDPESIISLVDLVEVVNARSKASENEEARELCGRHGKKAVAGSDAHTYIEIGRAVMEIEGHYADMSELKDALLKSERSYRGKSTPYFFSHGYSFLTTRIKKLGIIV